MSAVKTAKDILYALLSILVMIVLAIIFFIIILFIIKFAADTVFESVTLSADFAVLSAVILTAVSMLGGAYYVE
ncbi:MAG: hypothetical protein GX137_04020 [Thermoplasmatales archaeon]|jgi:hypothetical protein|nr:hypothetical protein [Thermoplasmatales archaeon]